MKQKSELMSDVFVKSKVIVILGSLTIKATYFNYFTK